MPDIRKNEQLRGQRLRRQLTQEELAEAIGTTEVNVSRWENGTNFPSPFFRRKLCAFFGVGPEGLGLASTDEGPSGAQSLALPSLWNVPLRRNPLFTGRDDVLQRITGLCRTQRVIALTQTQALSGLGGIGKTQTAVEYAYRHSDEYQAVLWVRADSRQSILSDFVALAHLLALPEKDEQDQNRIVEAVKRWLSTHTDWLLIFDNADDLQVASDFVTSLGSGHILLTTRMRNTGPFAEGIEVPKLSREESVGLLLSRAGLPPGHIEQAEREAAEALAELLDGLPLALDQAGAYIQETACGVRGYLDRYQKWRDRLLRTRDTSRKSDHPDSVAVTLGLSIARVEQANPAAAELLRLCTFLHPDAIPEEILTQGAAELGPILGPVAADVLQLDSAIGDLRRFSLLERRADKGTLAVHRLVQAILVDAMPERQRKQWRERVARALNSAFPEVTFEEWTRCGRLLPHVLVCATWGEHEPISTIGARLFHKSGVYLRERGQYVEAEPILERAATLYEQHLGGEHPNTTETLNDLALLYKYAGKYEQAGPLHKRVLSMREQRLGAEHVDTAESLHNLACVYMYQGDYEQAEPLYMRALSIYEHQLGVEHVDTAKTLHDLALLYSEQGKYEQAEPLLQQAISTLERCLGADHPDMGIGLNNLADFYRKQGKYEQAEPVCQRALSLCEQHLGAEHVDTARSVQELALLYSEQGKYEQVEPLLQRAVSIFERRLGTDHPETALSLHELGKLQQQQGKYEQAEALYQRALAVLEQQLEATHPQLQAVRKDYATFLRLAGRDAGTGVYEPSVEGSH